MDKNKIFTFSAIILIILGLVMIYIGGIYAPKLIIPPIITGVGFFVIARVILFLRK